MTGHVPPGYGDTLAEHGSGLVGHRVGNFSIQRLIGQGAMGSVYLGVHETLNRYVAIKVLQPELAANETLVNRFVDEARAASQLGHPGLVQVFDFGVMPDGRRYSVMEFLNGRDLEAAIESDGPQPIGRVAAIGQQVASALGAAHAKGIIHRDLKPANLFLALDESGAETVKVLDFGIAKLLAGQSGQTQAGHIVGTPEYMAPEQAQAYRDIDRRADIYSLGCVLYELLIGRPPHTGDNIPSILVAHLQDEPVPPTHLRRDIPVELERIVMRCLAKNKEHRYQSMAEVSAALAPYSDSPLPVVRGPRTLPPPTQPSMRGVGHARLWIAGLLGLLVVGGAVAALVIANQRGSTEASSGAGAVDAGAAGTVSPTAAADKNPYTVEDKAVLAAGAVIWKKSCAGCHGEHGEGDGPNVKDGLEPKSFSEVTADSDFLDYYQYEIIQRGTQTTGMPSFAGKLSPDDTWKVVTFIRTLHAKKASEADVGLESPQPETTKKLIARGKKLYRQKCSSCHGKYGRGNGRASEYLNRLPADLTWGIYKLRSTPNDSIPTDRDIFRTLSVGVGTGIMPGFPKLPPDDRWALVAYTKTLSKRFTKEKPGEVADIPPRPKPTAESLARGKSVFQMSGCPKCHGDDGRGDGPQSKNQKDARGNTVEPPDFNDRFDFLSGTKPEAIYKTMWNGLAGVKMPMGQTLLTEKDAWDVVNWIISTQKR